MNDTPLQIPPHVSDSDRTTHWTLISKKQIAKLLSVSVRTIDNWVRQKRIPVHRFSSRCIRFNPPKVLSALDKFEIREVGRLNCKGGHAGQVTNSIVASTKKNLERA
jgi:excisionase family DNA binding protein